MSDDECIDCGKCWWTDCRKEADYTVNGVEVIYKQSKIFLGDVDMCAGHYRYASRSGHMNIAWFRVERVLTS